MLNVVFHILAASVVLLGQEGSDPPAQETGHDGIGHTIPFTLNRGLIQVEARVNGRGPYRFTVDTGASGPGRIDVRLVEELALPALGRALNQDGVGGGSERTIVSVSELSIGGYSLGETELMAADYSWVRSEEEGRIDGIIGYELLRRTPFTVDYSRGQLILDVPPLRDGGDQVIALDTRPGVPLVPLKIGDDEGIALLDTGSDSALSMPNGFLEMLALTAEPKAAGLARTSESEFDIVTAILGETVEVGPVYFTAVRAHFSDSWRYPILGYGLLRTCRITIDDKQGLIRLEQLE